MKLSKRKHSAKSHVECGASHAPALFARIKTHAKSPSALYIVQQLYRFSCLGIFWSVAVTATSTQMRIDKAENSAILFALF